MFHTFETEDGVNIRNACVSYGKKCDVISGVDVNIPKGTIYGLLGPSGSGKTTLLRCITGCINLDYGDVTVFGQKPGSPGLDIPGTNIGYMPQEAALYFDLTINEMLKYFANLYSMNRIEIVANINYLITVLDLPEKSRFIHTLSGGQKRRVSFAASIIHKPGLLVLDEPTAGVDPLLREKIWLQLLALSQKESMTIIITTQYIEESRRADKIGFMRKGKVIAEGKPDALLKRYGMSSLENVFLSLCSMKRKSTITSPEDLLNFKRKSERENSKKEEQKKNNKSSLHQSMSKWVTIFATIYWKNLLQDLRNPLTISLQYVSPISQILLFALCIGGNPFGIKVGIVNGDSTNMEIGKDFLSVINNNTVVQIPFKDMKSAMIAAKRREIWAVIEIPKSYSYALFQRYLTANVSKEQLDKSTIWIHADMADKIVATTTLRSIFSDYVKFTRKFLEDYDENPQLASPNVRIVEPIYGIDDENYKSFRDFMLPGMILNLTFAMAIAMSSLTLIAERSGQTFERNYVSGVNSTQMLLSHVAARITLSAPYVVLVVWLPLLLFDIPAEGNIWCGILLVLVQNITGMTCGMLISAVCKEIIMAMVMTSGCFMLFLFMSGTLWPLEAVPFYCRWLCFVSPTTLPTEALRNLLYRDWSFTVFGVWIGFGISFIWALIFFVFAAKYFRYNK